MLLNKLKIPTFLLLTLGFLGAGVGVLTVPAMTAEQQETPKALKKPHPKPAADAPKEAAPKNTELEGVWEVVSMVQGGTEVDEILRRELNVPDLFQGQVWVFHGNTLKGLGNATFIIDASKTPKTIDITHKKVSPTTGRAATEEGIYELKDDELKIALGDQRRKKGNGRPSDFEAKDQLTTRIVLKRIKIGAAPVEKPPTVLAKGTRAVLDPAPTLRATVEGHAKMILCAAISSDGKLLASGDLGGNVKLLDVAAGKEKTTLKLPGAVMCVTFSNDGKLLACGGRSYESSFGGGRRSFVKLWDVATGKEKANFEGHGVGPSILSVAFSGDGKLLASGATDGTAKLWDLATGKEKASLSHPGDVTLALSRDGKLLATGCKNNDCDVRLWDLGTGKVKATLKGHESNVLSVALSGDGKVLVSVDSVGVLKIWDVGAEREKATFSHVAALALTADGKLLASVDSEANAVRLWDVATAEEKASFKGALFDKATSSDVRLLVTANGRLLATVSPNGPGILELWDVPTSTRTDH